MPARTTIEGFAADLERASEALEVGLGDIVDKLGFDVMRGVSTRTPVDKGTAAGNWQASEGDQPVETVSDFKGSAEAAQAEALGSFAKIANGKPFRTIWIGNFLPYVERLEFGHSQQAPAGMVRVTLAEIEVELEDTLARAFKGAGL